MRKQHSNNVTRVRRASGQPADVAAANGGQSSYHVRLVSHVRNPTPSIGAYLIEDNPADSCQISSSPDLNTVARPKDANAVQPAQR